MYSFGTGEAQLLPSKNPANISKTDPKSKALTFGVCVIGLQVSYLSWGLIQERIIKHDYSNFDPIKPAERFTNTQFLVLVNRLFGLILSGIILVIFKREQFRNFDSMQKIVSAKHWAPLFICSYSSLSNVLSSVFQYEALKYVSFATQLLAKSSKSVCVMITGRIVMGKMYKKSEYFSVVLICLGKYYFV